MPGPPGTTPYQSLLYRFIPYSLHHLTPQQICPSSTLATKLSLFFASVKKLTKIPSNQIQHSHPKALIQANYLSAAASQSATPDGLATIAGILRATFSVFKTVQNWEVKNSRVMEFDYGKHVPWILDVCCTDILLALMEGQTYLQAGLVSESESFSRRVNRKWEENMRLYMETMEEVEAARKKILDKFPERSRYAPWDDEHAEGDEKESEPDESGDRESEGVSVLQVE